jgi:predicted ATPase
MQAFGRPVVTLYGELFAYEDGRPYRLLIEALYPVLQQMPAHRLSGILGDLGDLSNALNVLMPGLKRAPSAHEPLAADGLSIEDAICETVRLMAEDSPVLLILDGLQWIDAASLSVFDRLVRHEFPHLLIAALFRTDEAVENLRLRRVLDALGPAVDEWLHVTPLGPLEVHQMAAVLDDQMPADFGLWLYAETKGNPLHAEQLIRAYQEGPGETRFPRERPAASSPEDIILRRLERLPGPCLAALRQAAVLGQSFSFDDLRAALDQPEQRVLAHLELALLAGIMRGDAVKDRFSFDHPRMREAIYTEMLDGVRKRYHGRAARVFEQTQKTGTLDETVDLLAHHFLNAGELENALVYQTRAARRARSLAAYDVASQYVDQSLAVVEQLSHGARNEREREQRRAQRDDLLAARADIDASASR